MLAVRTICRLAEPIPAAAFLRKISIKGKTTFRFPPTFVENVLRTFSSFSIPVPIPALENTTSSGAIALHSSSHLRTATSSVTSSTSPRTVNRFSEPQSAAASHLRATADTRSASRPQKNMLRTPRFAHSTARASPIPLEAPVMRTVSGLLAYNFTATFFHVMPRSTHLLHHNALWITQLPNLGLMRIQSGTRSPEYTIVNETRLTVIDSK